MENARTVWVVADEAGRQLLRASAGRRALELWAVAFGLGFCLVAALAVHGASLAGQEAQVALLARRVATLHEEAQGLGEQLPNLEDLLTSNQAALTQLERKSGFTFVSLAQTGTGSGAGTAETQEGAAGATLPLQPAGAGALAGLGADAVLARGLRLEAWLGDLLEYWHDAERRLANTPSVRPARTAWLSSSYGVRIDPISHYTVMHKGLDMAGFVGMLVFAPADGRVIWTGVRGGYGQVVVLDHGWGLQTHYAHLSKYLVNKGDRVLRGEPIAEMGNTGKSTGPHLHYEVRQDGFPIDPRNFILD